MPKPERIYLLEVSYPVKRPYQAKGGGVFRTEADMNKRIATVKSRAVQRGVPVEVKTSFTDVEWTPLND